jgi:hypothetical protein
MTATRSSSQSLKVVPRNLSMTGAPLMISLAHTLEPQGRLRENAILAVM